MMDIPEDMLCSDMSDGEGEVVDVPSDICE